MIGSSALKLAGACAFALGMLVPGVGNAGAVAVPFILADMNGDEKSDFVLMRTDGVQHVRLLNGLTAPVEGGIPATPVGWTLIGLPDLSGDENADVLLINNTSGALYVYHMSGTTNLGTGGNMKAIPAGWTLEGTPDLNGDGRADIVLSRDSDGQVSARLTAADGKGISAEGSLRAIPAGSIISGFPDLNGDDNDDIAYLNTSTGTHEAVLQMGLTGGGPNALPVIATGWTLVGYPDLTGDEKSDILQVRTSDGVQHADAMDGFTVLQSMGVPGVPAGWTLAGLPDLNGDKTADILVQRTSDGALNGSLLSPTTELAVLTQGGMPGVPSGWSLAGLGDTDGDAKDDLVLLRNSDGAAHSRLMNGLAISTEGGIPGEPASWMFVGFLE